MEDIVDLSSVYAKCLCLCVMCLSVYLSVCIAVFVLTVDCAFTAMLDNNTHVTIPGII